jgi:hypothetical protein
VKTDDAIVFRLSKPADRELLLGLLGDQVDGAEERPGTARPERSRGRQPPQRTRPGIRRRRTVGPMSRRTDMRNRRAISFQVAIGGAQVVAIIAQVIVIVVTR